MADALQQVDVRFQPADGVVEFAGPDLGFDVGKGGIFDIQHLVDALGRDGSDHDQSQKQSCCQPNSKHEVSVRGEVLTSGDSVLSSDSTTHGRATAEPWRLDRDLPRAFECVIGPIPSQGAW